jgi:hypothetical protein
MALSALTRAVLPVVALARPDSFIDPDIVEGAVAGHGLDGEAPPNWMVAWFARIATRQPTPELFEVPGGYPNGDEGLVNVLLDIEEAIGPLGFDDCGESFAWPIPAAGLVVLTIRETADGRYYGAMRPVGSDSNKWLSEQYNRLRRGAPLRPLAEPGAEPDPAA